MMEKIYLPGDSVSINANSIAASPASQLNERF